MKKNKKISKPTEMEFYSIEETDGKKVVHVYGYCYDNENTWSLVEYVGHITPVKEFAEQMQKDDGFVESKAQTLNQGQDDFSEKEMTEIINTYFDGKPADYVLPYGEITEDTPVGHYVC